MTTGDANDGKFWTDDLPRCESTGVGDGTYLFSRSNPFVRDLKSQDRSFYCKVDENTYLYAIFSGHNGTAVAELAMQRMAAEILLGQLNGKNSDEEVKEVLRQAFLSVEKCYQESVETLIAKRTALQCQLMENCISKEAVQTSIKVIDAELSVGASVALCLIYKTKIFICNVGTCRVLLCKNDENKAPRVVQFSVDHTLWNEDEILRLRQLGLDLQKLRNASLCSTRCIGYYFGKTGYKNCDFFLEAKSEPIIAQPEIVGGIEIDGSFQFLVLISSGTCKALQDLFSADSAKQNKEIIRITAKHFEVHSSLHDIAQSVVNKIAAAHEELNGEKDRYEEYANMTVLIRDFHGSLSKCQQKRPNQVTFNSFVERLPPTEKNILDDSNNVFGIDTTAYSDTDTTTVSSISEQKPNEIFNKNRKIPPYVDFKPFYERVEKTKEKGSLPPEIEFD